MALLEHINSPADLKRLNMNQLPEVAAELRRFIIDTIAQTGGHFGGPLGCVEICIALHYILNSPQDKIVWDVGYQAYAHKILTGRRDRFHTLRQWEGVAPFPRVEESEHDTSNPGHGSTSISTALGYAVARDLKGGDETVVAVIGDGSLVGGLALEGLHQAGHLGTRLIVILNDNEMGISHNRSSLANYLRRVRTDPTYRHTRESLEEIFRKLPGGELVIEAGHKIRAGVRSMVVPGLWFEELGYHYLGPINGHSLPDLTSALKTAITLDKPVLLHAVTTKGKGYEKAEEAAGQVKWHAATPGDFKPAEAVAAPKGPPTYTQVFADTLIELAASDENIVAMSAAMPGGTGIDKFIERYPKRGFDVGMTEEHAVTFASGLALSGLRPVVAIYSTFLQRSFDQIIHDVCQVHNGLPVTFALDRGGLVGEDGATHQGLFDLSYLRCIPNMTVMAPKDEAELRLMLATCLSLDGPAAVRYPRGAGQGVPLDQPLEPLPVGKGEIVRDVEGKEAELAVIAIGYCVQPTLQAADALRSEGHHIIVVNARFVKPLDEELICAVARRAKRLITVEENVIQGGFGSAVLEMLQREGLNDLPVTLVGAPDDFVHHGAQKIQRRELGLDADGLQYTMRRHLPRRRKATAVHK
ncbi:MAG: 1-deoxy-D-xylulose-5-phosphate synthase [Armatimonadota bacterium]|nr:1-deoxy-D-xylulose-5-phosphate synthase [Armatimonadota bacterium]